MKKLIQVLESRLRASAPAAEVGVELMGLVRGFAAEEISKGWVGVKEEALADSFHFTIPTLGVDLLFVSEARGVATVWVRSRDARRYGCHLVRDRVGAWNVCHRKTSPLDADTFDQMVTDLVEGALDG